MNIKPQVMIDILVSAARDHALNGKQESAIELFEQALQRLEQTAGADSLHLGAVLADLSDSYEATGRTLQARQCRARLKSIISRSIQAS